MLYIEDIPRFSSPIFRRYPWVLKPYILKVPIGVQVLYFEGRLTSLDPIFRRYARVINLNILNIVISLKPMDDEDTVPSKYMT